MIRRNRRTVAGSIVRLVRLPPGWLRELVGASVAISLVTLGRAGQMDGDAPLG
jgi:hypothetical protein